MIITHNPTYQQNFTATNTVHSYASKTYKKLEKEFLEITHQQGINKGTIVELLKRMILSPKFEQQNLEAIQKELAIKIKQILDAINNGKNSEEIQTIFKLPEQAISGLMLMQATIKRAQEATKLYTEGMSIKSIAKEKNFKESTIRKYLASCGIKLAYPPIPKEKVAEMVNNGFSDIQIAEALGIHKRSVETIRKKLNLKCNRHKGKVQAIYEVIVKELEAGLKRKDIAKNHGICKERVDKIAEEIGAYRKNVAKRNSIVIEQLNKGVPPKAIAIELGISHVTVLRIARNNNITIKKTP